MDEDWAGLDNEAKSDRLCQIDEAGERCAFRTVADYFVRQGLAVERDDGSIAELGIEDGKQRVTVCRPDTEDFKQPGWDISVQIRDGRGAAPLPGHP